jgi:hypothetical protein
MINLRKDSEVQALKKEISLFGRREDEICSREPIG